MRRIFSLPYVLVAVALKAVTQLTGIGSDGNAAPPPITSNGTAHNAATAVSFEEEASGDKIWTNENVETSVSRFLNTSRSVVRQVCRLAMSPMLTSEHPTL